MKTYQFKFGDQTASLENYMDFYLKNKSRDCILYSEDGSKFKVHKELFGQTDFLRKILSSTKEHCCGTIEVFCPCSKEELSHLVNFLYDGEIHCEGESDSLKIVKNLQKIFGFPRNLDLNYPNESFSASVNTIEAMATTEEFYENILDGPNAKQIVIIPIRSRDVTDKLVASDQVKGDNILDNDGKKVSDKKNKSKKISCKKVKGSSMEKYPKKVNCNDCGASFIGKFGKNHLKRHINAVHLKLKRYECDQCKISFSQKYNMQKHVDVVHLKMRPFICDQCKKTFSEKRCLNQHVIEKCGKMKKKCYRCKDCDATFKTRKYLRKHVNRIHLKIKPLKKLICNECEASFEHKQLLEHHLNKVHLNVKPYKCNQCEKAFFIEKDLKAHVKKNQKEETK